jgi:hypothetical protein
MASAAGLNLDDTKTEQSFGTAWMARRPSDRSVQIGGCVRVLSELFHYAA